MAVDHEIAPQLAHADNGDGQLPRRRRVRVPSVRIVLGSALLAAIGFGGGVLEAKHTGTTSATSAGAARSATGTRTGAAAGFGAGGTGAGGTGAGAGASTVGTVKLVDGSTIYLTAADGSVLKVITTKGTKLAVTAAGKAGQLTVGSTVIVVGKADASGNVTATSVSQAASAAAGSPSPSGGAPAGAPGGAPGGAPTG